MDPGDKPRQLAELAGQFGISRFKGYPSTAIGGEDVTVYKMFRAYSVLASGGILYDPLLVRRMEDKSGNLLAGPRFSGRRVISEQEAYIMYSLFKNILSHRGTASSFRRVSGLWSICAAGKTGTTNESRDCWFMFYTPDIVIGVWVGYDDNRPMRDLVSPEGKKINMSAGRVAMPIVAAFMKRVAKYLPQREFDIPEELELRYFNTITGEFSTEEAAKLDPGVVKSAAFYKETIDADTLASEF